MKLKAGYVWVGVFTLWGVFLTGILGTPGIIQALDLKSLLEFKQAQITAVERDLSLLEAERLRLEKNRVAQEREVRRVLGYAASDEIIFDFTLSESASAPQK